MSDTITDNTALSGAHGRNYGIDLLRIVSMLYVVILHTLGQGGVLYGMPEHSLRYWCTWFMESWAYCAVDIFALISGWAAYSGTRKINYVNYVRTWFQVLFYSVLVTVGYIVFKPEFVWDRLLYHSFFPVTHNIYWYFTAYTGLVIAAPLLLAGVGKCSARTLKGIIAAIFIVFSLFGSYAGAFWLSGGYSFIWIALLYVMGAAVKKCGIGERLRPLHAFTAALLCCAASLLWKVFGTDFKLLDVRITRDYFYSYTSPAVLAAALMHVIFFSKLKIKKGGALQKAVSFAAPGAFAVYLLNTQPIIWQEELNWRFAFLQNRNTAYIILYVAVFALLFTAAALLIDKVRALLFSLAEKPIGAAVSRLRGKRNTR